MEVNKAELQSIIANSCIHSNTTSRYCPSAFIYSCNVFLVQLLSSKLNYFEKFMKDIVLNRTKVLIVYFFEDNMSKLIFFMVLSEKINNVYLTKVSRVEHVLESNTWIWEVNNCFHFRNCFYLTTFPFPISFDHPFENSFFFFTNIISYRDNFTRFLLIWSVLRRLKLNIQFIFEVIRILTSILHSIIHNCSTEF